MCLDYRVEITIDDESKEAINCTISNNELMNSEHLNMNLDLLERAERTIQDEFNIKFSLGCFKVPEILRMATANFTVGYVIKIDEKGRPKSVSSFWSSDLPDLRAILDSEEVISCIKLNWRFFGFDPGSAITVLLRWEHPKGFETLMIYSDKFSYVMRLSPTVYEDKKYW